MGNERLTLEIVGKSSGQADIEKLLGAFNKYVDSVEKGTKRLSDANKKQTDTARGTADAIKNLISNPVQAGTGAIENYALSLGKIGGVAVGVVSGVAAVGVGLIAITASAATAQREQVNLAARLGLTVGQTRQFSAITRLAGVDVTALEASTRILAQALEDSGGKGAKAATALQKLGVTTRESNGESRETGQVLLETIAALSKVENQAQRTALQNQILGRSSKEIAPLIANYKAFGDAAKQLGYDVTEGPSKSLLEFQSKTVLADLAWEKFKKSLAQKIAPIIIPVLEVVTQAFLNKGQTKDLRSEAGTIEYERIRAAIGLPKVPSAKQSQEQLLGDFQNAFSDQDRAKVLGQKYKGLVTSTPEYLNKQLADTKEKIGEANDKILNPAGAGSKAVEQAKQELTVLRQKETSLELQLKSIERAKSIAEDLIKLQQEENAKRAEFITLGNGIILKAAPLPAQGEFDKFANTPGVTNSQRTILARALQPRFALESQAAAQVAIGKQREDSVKVEESFRKILNPQAVPIQETIEEANARAAKDSEAFQKYQKFLIDDSDKKAAELSPILESTLKSNQSLGQNKLLAGFRIQEVREGPGSEIQQASVLLAIQKQNQQEVYERERNGIEALYKYDETLQERLRDLRIDNALKVQDLEIQAAEKVAEIQQKRADDIRNSFAEGVIALQGGGSSFTSFVKSQAQNLEKTVLSNLAGVVAPNLTGFPITKDPNSLLGKLAKNTIFGADQSQPLQGAATILSSSGFKLDAAAAHLEQAAVAIVSSSVNFPAVGGSGTDIYGNTIPDANLATGLSTFGSDTNGILGQGGILGKIGPLAKAIGSVPGLPGGSAIGGILGSLSTLQKVLGGDSGAPSITSGELGNIGVFSPTVPGGTVGSGTATAHSSSPLLNPLGTLFSSGSSTSDKLGAGVAIVGAGIAGINGINDIIHGGARRGIGGFGQLAGAASALDPEPISKGILAGVAVVSGIVSSLLPDPKLIRQQGITRELRDSAYHPPTSLALTFGENGNASDYDASGNARSSSFSNFPVNNTPGNIYRFNGQDINVPGVPTNPFRNVPNVTVQVSAMDSKSFTDNSQHIADAVRVALQSGHALGSEIQSLPGR